MISDKEIIEHLNFVDFYEASYRLKELKKEVSILKRKNTILKNKYDK